jgi:3-oxoacyl-[acyl-carrier-protein] synthase II
MRRRTVITGMGVITPLGDRPQALFEALLAGRSNVGPITRFDASTFPTTFAAEVRDFDLKRYVPEGGRWSADSGDASQFAAAAGRLALLDSGLLTGGDRDRFGVYLGSGECRQDFHTLLNIATRGLAPEGNELDDHEVARQALLRYRRGPEYEQELHTPSAYLADAFDLGGPNFACLTACAAGSQAIGEALDLIRRGDADLMLTGGAHSMIYPLGVTGFNLLTALSTRNDAPQKASRPFDLNRDGFVLGEGSGMVVLEELQHAKRRGATVYAELTGYGSTCDAFRVTDCHPDGRGALACIAAALKDGGLSPEQIDYVNAHGTSTRNNDQVETLAIKKAFGPCAYKVPISSSKSMLGHLIAAAGAVELVICVEAIRRGVVPPTINYETPDPACDLDYVPNVARARRVRHALSNSFGFGGQNASLIVSAFNG